LKGEPPCSALAQEVEDDGVLDVGVVEETIVVVVEAIVLSADPVFVADGDVVVTT